jgi:hypothetical protein
MPATDMPGGKRVRPMSGTGPSLLKQWFAPAPVTTPVAEVELRIGGANLIVMRMWPPWARTTEALSRAYSRWLRCLRKLCHGPCPMAWRKKASLLRSISVRAAESSR